MKIRALVALVLLVTTAGCAMHSRRDVLAETHATTVRLEMDGIVGSGSCSGTAIGRHLLLSATHCFENLIALHVNGKLATVIKRIDDGKDHTILVLDTTFTVWSELGKEPKQADKVFIWGNPSGFVDFYREGHVAGYVSGPEGRATLVDMPTVWFGDSGSAIFNESGQIVAVTSFLTYEEGQGVPLKFMGFFPFAFTDSQYTEVGYKAEL